MRRVTVLSPNLDDAVLSCSGVLAAAADVLVLNVFAGVPPAGAVGWWDRATGADDSVARMRERLEEDAAALAELGHAPVNLDFLEAQYRDGAAPGADELLAAAAGHVDPGGIVYGPAAIGDHEDHRLVRALLAPLQSGGADVRLYADLPYCARYGWPGWVTGGPADGDEAEAQWARALDGAEIDLAGLSPRAVRLDRDAQEQKRRVLAAYRTQFAALTTGGSLHVADPGVLPFEVYWEPSGGEPVIAAASRA
jgi:hypothetical protein